MPSSLVDEGSYYAAAAVTLNVAEKKHRLLSFPTQKR